MLSYIRSLFTILCTILFLSHLTNQNVMGQVVTFEPSFATQNDSLTVYFDATEGNGALEGFTGRVFLHTGVITSLSKSGSDWKYVPAGWESYPSNLEAKQVAQNLWKFTFGPNIREFFGISNTSEQVVEVAMLFKGTRSLSGAPIAIGRDVGGKDIFIELSSGGVEARFVLPIAPLNLIQQADAG